ncbi:MAG: sigma-70 family RNA polymerase sigma factor [Actinomycetota bacterium]|nr:sigma-70 family RNA polymerase sigma factor [Actinomycetota bacterium]
MLPEIDLLLRVARSLTRSTADAEDLVQETLLRAFRSINSFDGRYPRAWLLTNLRNANINMGRKKRPGLLNDPESSEYTDLLSDNEAPESRHVDGTFDATIDEAFRALSPESRQVVELVDLHGLAYQEAADAIGIPVGTVMSRLHRARRSIRTAVSVNGLDSQRPVTTKRTDR